MPFLEAVLFTCGSGLLGISLFKNSQICCQPSPVSKQTAKNLLSLLNLFIMFLLCFR